MAGADQTHTQPLQLTLVKKSQRWVFRYQPGQEEVVLASLANTARDPRAEFDWFDAAVLGHQMGDRLNRKLKAMMDT